MTSTNPGQDFERFEAALRRWGARAPQTTSQQAAARVEARLQRQPRAASMPWLAAAAAMLVALALATVLGSPTGVANSHPVAEVTAPLPDNIVVSWIDAQTPLYFIVTATNPQNGASS